MKLARMAALLGSATIGVLGFSSIRCVPGLDEPERFQAGCPEGFSVEAMMRERCSGSGCHGSDAPASGLDLTTAGAFERMLGVTSTACNAPLISPDGPSKSLLLHKVDGTTTCGARMPLGQDALSASEVACVEAWIADQLSTAPPPSGNGGAGG